MIDDDRIQNVVIVGGGIAGGLAALGLVSVWGKKIRIRVISPQTASGGIVAALPTLGLFHQRLRLREDVLVRAVGAGFSLGCAWRDWGENGNDHFQPFAENDERIGLAPLYQQWIRAHQAGRDVGRFEEYTIPATAARQNRFYDIFARDPGPQCAYGLQLDSARYVAFLREAATKAGVLFTKDKVTSVNRRRPDDFIESLVLQSGDVVTADLFLDCSGRPAVLAGPLEVAEAHSLSTLLPCDRAVIATLPNASVQHPYSEITTAPSGWKWRLTTPDTLAVGYAFSSRHCSDEDASKHLLSDHSGKAPLATRYLSFRSGYRKRFWTGNCIAIGASAGFLEPLEPVALQMIQSGIAKLLGLFPDRSCAAGESTEYSRLMAEEYARLADLVVMRYAISSRDDTPFWHEVRAGHPPAELAHKLRLFSARGTVAMYDNEIFLPGYWVSALLGNGRIPAFHDRLADSLDFDEACRQLDAQRLSMTERVAAMPSYAEILQKLQR